ncbi:hypothetical protein GCM10023094_49420 [Rhodococcus olei]|uniref:Uncharacterized protein n=1 Tax=Rhodococcus olei TaxID=2161675 RepID=A0ABP8PNA4_9NOCA
MPTHPHADRAAPAGTADPAPARPAVAAVLIGLIGALAGAFGPVLGVARPGAGPAVVAAAAVATGCAVAAPALALVALSRRRYAAAGAVLAGAGAIALGAAVLDVALWTDTIDANRLELFRPLTAAHLEAGAGAYAVLAGHVAAVAAGVAGLVAIARASREDGYGQAEDPRQEGLPVGRRIGPSAALAVAAAGLALAGSFAAPWSSADPVLVVHPLLGSPAPTAVGGAVIAVAMCVVVATALSATSVEVAGHATVGAGLAALSVFGTRVAAGVAAGDRVSVAAGSLVAAVGAVLLIVVGALMPRAAARPRDQEPRRAAPPASRATTRAGVAAAAARARTRRARWHAAAGVTGMVAGVLAAAGSLLPVLAVPAGVPQPQILATRVALVAGLVLLIACVGLVLSEFAPAVRPAVGVLWVAQVAAVAAVLQAVVVASDLPGVAAAPGAFVLGASVLAAVATGLLTWCAGSVEREALDTSEGGAARVPVLVAGGAAALVSTIALALPLYSGAGYSPGSVATWPWGWDLWGRGVLAVALWAVAAVAARARPARAAAGAVGAAISMGVYLIGWPLTSGRIEEPVIGPGAVGAILAVLLFAVAAVVAVRPKRR